MKKLFFLAAVATMTLASCMNDEFIGAENSPTVANTETDAINFGSGFKAVTRANDSYGKDAADLLGRKFIVGGVKGNGTSSSFGTNVFSSYTVDWVENSAGKTESNTADWDYVGKAYEFTPSITQGVKYWDYSTDYYNFCAYSVGNGNNIVTSSPSLENQVQASTIDFGNLGTKAYTLKGWRADLLDCYITDMTPVAKAAYGNEVTLKFRALASKVRMALYETVPGYKVKDVRFYQDDTTPINTNISSNNKATLIGSFDTGGEYTVKFNVVGSNNSSNPDCNKAHVTLDNTGHTPDSKFAFGEITYNADYLKTTSKDPSFAVGGDASHYVKLLPNENGQVLEMRVNYTLEAEDGKGEEITVHGAKAFIPAIYAKWMPNYAYTYIFKITDNTNGWTNITDDENPGLFPITFDAVVLNSEETGHQTTITTVATPSITTYQKGHVYSASDEYVAGKIYVRVMDNGASPVVPKADLDTKAKLYTLSAGSWTEADVMDALNIYTSSDESSTVGRNGLTLTNVTSGVSSTITKIPGEDGNDITVDTKTATEFTATTSTIYAYVYDATPSPAPAASYIYAAEKLTADPMPTNFITDYYRIDPSNGDYVLCVAGDYVQNNYYYKRYTDQNKVYSVKIIKVE